MAMMIGKVKKILNALNSLLQPTNQTFLKNEKNNKKMLIVRRDDFKYV